MRSLCTAVREKLYAHAHRMHAAADLGCKESSQRVYELLSRYGHLMGSRLFIN